jgi:non-ribosomal peptide synthetase component F
VPELRLPHDFSRTANHDHRGGFFEVILPQSEVASLCTSAQACSTTLFGLFTAAFVLLLGYESRQDHFAIATDVIGREDPLWENVVGDFVNQILVVADLSGNPSMERLIRRTAAALNAAFELRAIPFEHLLPILRQSLPKDAPHFSAKIVMQPADASAAHPPMFELLSIHDGSCKFELLLNIWRHGSEIGLTLEHSRDLFTDTTAQRFLRELCAILKMMHPSSLALQADDVQQRLSAAEERHPTRQGFVANRAGTLEGIAEVSLVR